MTDEPTFEIPSAGTITHTVIYPADALALSADLAERIEELTSAARDLFATYADAPKTDGTDLWRAGGLRALAEAVFGRPFDDDPYRAVHKIRAELGMEDVS